MHKGIKLKFIGRIKKAIKRKNKETIPQPEALLKIDAIRAEYNLDEDELKAELECAREFYDAFHRQKKTRKQEGNRQFIVDFIGKTFFYMGFLGLAFFLAGPAELIFDECGPDHSLSVVIRLILLFGFPFLALITFFWLSDKTGFHYFLEDWVESWDTPIEDWVASWITGDVQQSNNIQKFRTFPRRKRNGLIRDIERAWYI